MGTVRGKQLCASTVIKCEEKSEQRTVAAVWKHLSKHDKEETERRGCLCLFAVV